jgi:hypothetical protein
VLQALHEGQAVIANISLALGETRFGQGAKIFNAVLALNIFLKEFGIAFAQR